MVGNAHAERRALQRANAMILEKIMGVPAQAGTPDTEADSRNPNAVSRSFGVGHSAEDSSVGSGRAPRQVAPALRLVWCVPSRE
jgi:hypothetical protein